MTRILIAGSGVAGLEAMIALRAHLGASVEIVLLDRRSELVYRPLSVAEPFGIGEAHRRDIGPIAADHGATFLPEGLAGVDADARSVRTTAGREHGYDVLLVAVGARPDHPLAGAIAFRGPRDVPAMAALLRDMEHGRVRRIAFAVPAGVAWTLPAYELALLTAERARQAGGARAHVALVTPEPAPMHGFGRAASDAIARLLADRGIAVHAGAPPRRLEPGGVGLEGGGHVAADRVVALPRLLGPWLAGLPRDHDGFIPTDEHGAVCDVAGVYAAGDATTFPIKQGGIAAQQADAAAAAIAASLGAPVAPEPFRPVLRAMLLDARAPRFLRRADGRSEASLEALWWPPAKIAAPHLAPYLAGARVPGVPPRAPLEDRATPPAPQPAEAAVAAEHAAVADLMVTLADDNARHGEFGLALRCLDAIETLRGALPPGYAAKRREWDARLRPGARRAAFPPMR